MPPLQDKAVQDERDQSPPTHHFTSLLVDQPRSRSQSQISDLNGNVDGRAEAPQAVKPEGSQRRRQIEGVYSTVYSLPSLSSTE